MNNFSVEIHEFSTGINAQMAADGSVISGGFKVGEVGNSTLAEIPPAVKRAIGNKEFAVAESAYSKEPAVIGRVVLGNNGEDNWSVVAVVIEFGDERGRSFSAYRYFLCEGDDSLWKIVAWMEDYQRAHGQLPVFNPVETRKTGQHNAWSISTRNTSLPEEAQDWVIRNPDPIIIPPDRELTLQAINEMAVIKANSIKQPVSWAYNVEALERQDKFIIIWAASTEAFNRIKRLRDVQINKPRVLAPAVDENEIEIAVKGLMSRSQVRAKNIETIIANLDTTKVSKDYWSEIFNRLGAANALSLGSSHDDMVRLLTLRAIVIPETLPEFLDWLQLERNVNPGDGKQTRSLEFQSQITNYLEQLASNIAGGIEIALAKLLEKEIAGKTVVWLLTVKSGIWAEYLERLKDDVRRDLDIISRIFVTFPSQANTGAFKCGEAIWKDLKTYWQQRCSYKNEKYEPFAALFKELKDYELAAYFYQVSNSEVPKKIFELAFGEDKDKWEANVFGLKVIKEGKPKRKQSNKEDDLIVLGIIGVIFLIGAIFGFGLGIAVDRLFLIRSHDRSLIPLESINPPPSQTSSPATTAGPNVNPPLESKVKQDFENKTKAAFKQITGDLLADSELNKLGLTQELGIKMAIKETLGAQNVDYAAAIEQGDETQIQKLVNAISSYQKSKKTGSDGIIDPKPDGKTFNKLKEEVKAKLKDNPEKYKGN